MSSLNPKVDHSVRSGAKPGERAWHQEAPDTAGPIRLPEFGIDLSLDAVYAGVDFD